MRLLRVFLSIVALCVVAGPVLVSRAAADDVDTCKQAGGDEAIAACTRVIGSGGDLAWAYVNRGRAYFDKGDLDHAIADYNDAIRLDPKSGLAYVSRGWAYSDKGYLDHAIADYTEAIRLDPLPAVAPSVKTGGYGHLNVYLLRGDAYLAKGDLDRALADYEEAVRLDPEHAYAYNGRGNAYLRKGDDDRAIADYNDASRLYPKYADNYRVRGLAYLYSGNPVKALTDVSQSSELDPTDAYNALWVDIIGQRNNVPSRLSQAISTIDMTAWPAPVIRMWLGQTTSAAVIAAADDRIRTKRKGQVCEGNFYSGELALRQGAKDEATRLFVLAAKVCPMDFDEWIAANRELKALGAAP